MASPNRPARLNRTLLGLTALVLIAAAVLTLLTAFGVLEVIDRGQALTAPSADPPTWVALLTVVVAAIVGLLALRWLLAQTRRRAKTGTWRLEADPAAGVTRLDAQDAVAPLVEEVEAYPGVHRASARLAGTAVRPMLYLTLGTEDTADVTALRDRIDNDAIPRLCQALDLQHLPAEILIRLDDAHTPRAARLT